MNIWLVWLRLRGRRWGLLFRWWLLLRVCWYVPDTVCILTKLLTRSFFAGRSPVDMSFQTRHGWAIFPAKTTVRHGDDLMNVSHWMLLFTSIFHQYLTKLLCPSLDVYHSRFCLCCNHITDASGITPSINIVAMEIQHCHTFFLLNHHDHPLFLLSSSQ